MAHQLRGAANLGAVRGSVTGENSEYGPAWRTRSCLHKRNIRFAHISTDAVFDGTKDGFTRKKMNKAPGVYSQTKLDGERAVQQGESKAIIARVNFYGWSLGGRRSPGEFFVNNLSEAKQVNGFTDVIFCPMLVNDTARLLLGCCRKT